MGTNNQFKKFMQTVRKFLMKDENKEKLIEKISLESDEKLLFKSQ